MKTGFWRWLGLLAMAVLACDGAVPARAANSYYFLREIPIGGVAGTPSMAIDPDGRRLYVTHSTKIEVVDLEKGEVAGIVSNTPSVRDLAVAPELQRGFSSNSRDGIVSVIDLKNWAVAAKWDAAPGLGPMLYVPGQGQVYAFNTRAPAATVFEAASGKVAATVPLPGKPQVAAVESGAGLVYCALFDRNEVAVLNAKTHRLAGAWPVAPGKEPAGIAVDVAAHRIFVGCRNKLLVMLDEATGRVAASVPIGTGVDATAFDPSSGLVFCANSDGTATIAHEDSPEKLSVAQTLTTERNARIMALDPKTHKIYLATTDFAAPSEPEAGAPQGRPRTLANTLKILVYGPAQP